MCSLKVQWNWFEDVNVRGKGRRGYEDMSANAWYENEVSVRLSNPWALAPVPSPRHLLGITGTCSTGDILSKRKS